MFIYDTMLVSAVLVANLGLCIAQALPFMTIFDVATQLHAAASDGCQVDGVVAVREA